MINRNEIAQTDEDIFTNENIRNVSALLSLLHGKSDSICRLFRKEITVTKSDLCSLNKRMCEKLALHPNSAVTTTIDIAFSNKRIVSFKTWAEFEQYDFSIENSPTKTVFIQWDFLLALKNYKVPQRHTVSIRITSTPNPSDFFRILLNGGFDEENDFELQSSTMVCRVDFINHALAEELINVADKWNELCEKSTSNVKRINKFAFKHRNNLAKTFELLFLILFSAILAISIKLFMIYNNLDLTLDISIYILISLFPYFQIVRFFAHKIAQWLYDAFAGAIDSRIFDLTKGDKKEIEKAKQNNAIGKEITVFSINLIASIIVSSFFFIIG